MSPAFCALCLYGPHSAPVTMWLAVLCSILPAHWFTYMYDTFVVWPNRKKELHGFVRNGVHQNNTFTMETECSSIFHRCPGQQNTRLVKLYAQYIENYTKPKQNLAQKWAVLSHYSPTRWYTV